MENKNKTEEKNYGSDRNSILEIPSSLIDAFDKEFNGIGSVKIETVNVLVHAGDIRESIEIIVEKPDICDVESFSREVERRILKKLQWLFSVNSFSFGDVNGG